jgi:hypothetical protein
MTTPPDKPKRWRPRFSVRTLVVLVTLVCCYAACWQPTKKTGVNEVVDHIWAMTYSPKPKSMLIGGILFDGESASAIMPFVVQVDQWELNIQRRSFYFWFFGYVAKLPFERELD